MASTDYFHGTRVFTVGESARDISVDDYSTIGMVVTAPAADADKFPLNVPVTMFSNDTAMRTALGVTGTGKDAFDGIEDQGVIAEVQVVRVEESTDEVPADKLAETIANMVGSSATLTGVHAFKQASKPAKILIAPGFTSQRIAAAANPVMSEFAGVADRLRAIVIGETGNANKEAAVLNRTDFADQKRFYLIHPDAKVMGTDGTPVVQPLSARVAGLFVKMDKTVGGPYQSPSNQSIGGIVGLSRPITYYDGEPDSEANYLNEQRIATVIDGSILWGNETLALDPLDRFINVVRTNDLIDSAVVKAFRPWALDRNMSVPLAVSIIQSLDAFLDVLKAKGAILGGRAWFERDVNSNEALSSGILRIEYDREPAAPLQDLQFGARRNIAYYADLANGILQSLDRQDIAA